ncbi:hydroxymethylglutaryl-CoA lyase [Streptomyces fuscichromogenes]|uniref:Hydroxymethylglutaryl-CoA lyase n=1 Tax=Streptomyces fuscichromogenes TaxID=1324013 RepID=A0A918CPB8_9ACTN|nr:hydroxymethylglutaryl-CoA lyase [Streptomyces fuscichromogenes]GGM98038.1 hydroxymethylglutaryl-CoA lyase [Streptomyces fuscichromogenes]
MSTSAVSTPLKVGSAKLPSRVTVFEVGPRDGLQNEATPVPVEVKAEFVERLVDAGVRALELTSLVRPDRVPQLADAEELLRRLDLPEEVRTVVLTPNEKAVRRAVDAGVREIAVFASCTETFSRRNLGRSVDESLRMFEPVVEYARRNGLAVRGYFSMACGDPWEGAVPVEQAVAVARRLDDLGCTELSLGDTIGVGTPGQTVALIDAVVAAGIGMDRLAVHLHDTYGQALANASAAITRGVTVVDASAGGLGGCPFAGSSTGNLATEDLLWHLHGLGIETGIDLHALAGTSAWLAGHLGRPSPSRAAQAITQAMT